MQPNALELIEVQNLLEQTPGWSLVSVDGVERIERSYDFCDQVHATNFVHLLGEIANAANHHPSFLVQRLKVTVAWWTFSLGSLTRIDFVMAQRTDHLYEALANR